MMNFDGYTPILVPNSTASSYPPMPQVKLPNSNTPPAADPENKTDMLIKEAVFPMISDCNNKVHDIKKEVESLSKRIKPTEEFLRVSGINVCILRFLLVIFPVILSGLIFALFYYYLLQVNGEANILLHIIAGSLGTFTILDLIYGLIKLNSISDDCKKITADLEKLNEEVDKLKSKITIQ